MLDAGNYATDISHALADRYVQVLVRLRATRVFYADPEPRRPFDQEHFTGSAGSIWAWPAPIWPRREPPIAGCI